MNQEVVEDCVRLMLKEGLGLDLSDPNLKDTPKRVAKMYCQEFFSSLNIINTAPVLTYFPNDGNYDEIIILDNVPYTSMCAHHFLPFSGRAWFAYLPDKRLVGASKVARVIEYFSKKPQIQETLGQEVMDYFVGRVEPKGAVLVMRGVHGCMSCRGVRTGDSAGMITSKIYGTFKTSDAAREEVMQLINLSLHDKR